MILSFATKETERFSAGERIKAFEGIERSARLKLNRLRAAQTLGDVATLPGNRFEALKGDRAGQFSVRVNDRWRICFSWNEELKGFADVEIVDYH